MSNKLKYLALALLPVFAAQAFVPGEVVKGSGPKVYVIENDQRHWIPDPPTLIQKYGGWANVHNVSDAELFATPEGPKIPSVLIFPGAVVKGSGPKVYVIENNQRRWIPDPPTLIQNYGGWPAVRDVSDEDLLALTEGPQFPSVINANTLRVENMHSKMNNSGSRYMITSVTLTKDGKVLGNTYAHNDILFTGYHGRVDVVFKDANGNVRHSVGAGPYGVGAKAFEKHQVWANWEGTVPADILPDIVEMEIVHSWDPNYSAVRRAINEAVEITDSIVKLGEN